MLTFTLQKRKIEFIFTILLNTEKKIDFGTRNSKIEPTGVFEVFFRATCSAPRTKNGFFERNYHA